MRERLTPDLFSEVCGIGPALSVVTPAGVEEPAELRGCAGDVGNQAFGEVPPDLRGNGVNSQVCQVVKYVYFRVL